MLAIFVRKVLLTARTIGDSQRNRTSVHLTTPQVAIPATEIITPTVGTGGQSSHSLLPTPQAMIGRASAYS